MRCRSCKLNMMIKRREENKLIWVCINQKCMNFGRERSEPLPVNNNSENNQEEYDYE